MENALLGAVHEAAAAIERAVQAARREATTPAIAFDALAAIEQLPLPSLLDALSFALERAAERDLLTHDFGEDPRGGIAIARLGLTHASKGVRLVRESIDRVLMEIAWISTRPQ